MRLLSILFSLLFVSGLSVAQSITKIDSAYIHGIYERSRPFWRRNQDSARFYLNKVESLSKQVGYRRGEAYAIYALGFNEDVLYRQFIKYTKAFEIFESLGDQFGMGLTLLRIGSVYTLIGQPDKALEYYQRSLDVRKKLNDAGGVALTLISIGQYYSSRADYNKALEYFRESLTYRWKEGTHQGIGYAQVNISSTLLNLNDPTEALLTADSAIFHFSFTKDIVGQIWSMNLRGKAMLSLGRAAEAEKAFETIVQYPEDAQWLNWALEAKRELIRIFAARSDVRRAFELQSQYLIAQDSLARRDYRTETQRLANEYEFNVSEQKEQRERLVHEQQIARRNSLEYLSIAILVILIFVVLFSRRGKMSVRLVDISLLIGLLLFFEFFLILTDSTVDRITQGEPLLKLLANVAIGLLILPGHQFLERYTRKKLVPVVK